MRRVAILLVIMAVNLGAVAVAHDHRAPKSTLHVAGKTQRGLLYHADGWSKKTKDPRYCEATFGHGFPMFRKPVRHAMGDEIIVRLHKAAPPLEIEVYEWPRIDEEGHAQGNATPLPWVLRPHQGERPSWEVVIALPPVRDHTYLGLGAYWGDEDGCSQTPDLGSQYAAWTFHLTSD